MNYEIGYQGVLKGPDGWLTGLVIGHDFTPKLEGDVEFYNQGPFHPSENQPTIDFGGRYKIHSPVIFSLHGRTQPRTRAQQSVFARRLFRDPTSASAEIVQIQFAGNSPQN